MEIKNVVNATYHTTCVNITFVVENETNVSYLIINNETGAHFTVVNKSGKIEVVNSTKGLDVNYYRFNLTKIGDEYVLSIFGVECGNYTFYVLNDQSACYNSSNSSGSFKIVSAHSCVNITNVSVGVYNTTPVVVNVSVVNQTVAYFIVSNSTHNFTVNISLNGNGGVSLGFINNTGDFKDVKIDVGFSKNDTYSEGELYVYLLNITGLFVGEYNITFVNEESVNYTSSVDNNTFSVVKANSSVNIFNVGDGVFNTTSVVVNVSVVNQTNLSDVYFSVVNSSGSVIKILLNNITWITSTNGVVNCSIDDVDVNVSGSVIRDNLIYNYTFVISALSTGDYNITVYNNDGRNYNGSEDNNSFIYRANSTVNITKIIDGVYNTTIVSVNVSVVNRTVSYFVVGNGSDNFTVNITNDDGAVLIDCGRFEDVNVNVSVVERSIDNLNYTYVISIGGLDAGDYNITFYNNESVNYNGSVHEVGFVVFKVNSSVNISNVSGGVFNTTSVVVNVSVVNQTNVSFVVGNKTGNVGDIWVDATYSGNYNYTVCIGGLDAGDYNITFYNGVSGNYNGSVHEVGFVVFKANSSVNISNVGDGVFNTTSVVVNVSVVNQTNVSFVINNGTDNFTVNLTCDVNGEWMLEITKNNKFSNVNVTVKENTGNNDDNVLVYLFNIGGLNTGYYNITFNNREVKNYNSSLDNSSFRVYKANSSVDVINSTNSVFNQTITNITYNIVNITDVSYIFINNKTGLNFTVIKEENGEFKVVNQSAGLDIDNYKFDLVNESNGNIYYLLKVSSVEITQFMLLI